MSIGETLAQARRRAGLTLTEVSRRTRIRETLVRDIERDDYSATGGDFYTRGHIRAIARVVGTDPEPLIEEYDAARRQPSLDDSTPWRELLVEPGPGGPDPGPQTTAAFPAEPATGPAGLTGPVISVGDEEDAPYGRGGAAFRRGRPLPPRTHRRRRRNTPLLAGAVLVVVLGLLGYFFVAGTGGSPGSTPAAGVHSAGTGADRASPGGRAAGSAHTVVVHLTAIKDTLVVFTTPHGGYLFRSNVAAGTSKRWTFSHPVHMRLASPAGVKLAVDGKNPLPSGSARPVTLILSPGRPATVTATPSHPTPRASTPAPPAAQPLIPASAAAFGPSGGQGDNPSQAQLAIDGKPSTAWNTDWYTTANFGNLYAGTGLLLDMGRPVTITGAQITLGGSAGTALQLRVGSAPTLAALSPVARASGVSGTVRLQPTTPAHGRYLLIWFTKLPLTSAGNYEASVYDVKVQGYA